jgi:hypothetical protein
LEQQLADLKNLRSEVRQLLSRPIQEKIDGIEKNVYIQYDLGDSILLKMERLLSMKKSCRPIRMLISSPSGKPPAWFRA